MRRSALVFGRHLLAIAAIGAAGQRAAQAQDAVVVSCAPSGQCTYDRAYSPTLNGDRSVKLLPPQPPNDPRKAPKPRTGRLASLPGLYREPGSGLLRVMDADGQLGELVTPAKGPRAGAPGAGTAGWTFEFQEQPRGKARSAVPAEQVVALLRGARPAHAVVEFLKGEVRASHPHPFRDRLITAAVAFTEASPELQRWREDVRETMRRSLDLFRKEAVDPARLESTLAEGVAAMAVHRLVASDAQQDEVVQRDLEQEHRRLLDRFAIAGALRKSGLDDAFLEKLNQIGLARWSRPELAADAGKALEASAALHYARAKDLFKGGQYGLAFDEARLASSRAGCSDEMDEFYYRARLEFVNRSMVPATPDYANEHRSVLQQIVRELQGGAQEVTPERAEYVRKRIAEGERLDKDYLPLQLEKAEFLASIGELTASREVVSRVERTVPLGRAEAEEWLRMDAELNSKLVTLRQTTARILDEQIGGGQFEQALTTAAAGLRAEPENPTFLYLAAIASAVRRERDLTRQYVQRYLRRIGMPCGAGGGNGEAVVATLFEVYRREPPVNRTAAAAGTTPNWISGEYHAPGEAFYDPMSGSFGGPVLSSVLAQDKLITATEFRWEGFLVTSILTTTGQAPGARRTLLELEPVYDSKRVYMSGIATRANSAGQRRVMPLRYLNSPDFDPVLASKFTGTVSTRGWAGNPFFHPFIWNDIYLFDLVYDERGRLREAIPVLPDATRPVSPFSERLTFTWDGVSNRLKMISGARYRRELTYDDRGRLVFEKITHASGKGKIEYAYKGDQLEPSGIRCEDNFYDRGERIVHLRPAMER